MIKSIISFNPSTIKVVSIKATNRNSRVTAELWLTKANDTKI
jgi:hypothetical protein